MSEEWLRWMRVANSGIGISHDDARALESSLLVGQADDVPIRIKLVGYYYSQLDGNESHGRHLIWLIRNAPDVDLHFLGRVLVGDPSYVELESALLDMISDSPDDPRVLIRAAGFCRNTDAWLTEILLRRGLTILPHDAHLNEMLRALLSMDRKLRAPDLKPLTIGGQILSMVRQSRRTLAYGGLEAVEATARDLLPLSQSAPPSWVSATGVNYSHVSMGHVMLSRGLLHSAIEQLLLSAQTGHTCWPDLSLARSFLVSNQRGVVADFLRKLGPTFDQVREVVASGGPLPGRDWLTPFP